MTNTKRTKVMAIGATAALLSTLGLASCSSSQDPENGPTATETETVEPTDEETSEGDPTKDDPTDEGTTKDDPTDEGTTKDDDSADEVISQGDPTHDWAPTKKGEAFGINRPSNTISTNPITNPNFNKQGDPTKGTNNQTPIKPGGNKGNNDKTPGTPKPSVPPKDPDTSTPEEPVKVDSEALALAKENAAASLVMLNDAKAALAQAQTTLDNAKDALEAAKRDVADARQELEDAILAAATGNEKAANAVSAAQARLDSAIAARDNIEEARTAAQADYDLAFEEYEAYTELTDLANAELNLEQTKLDSLNNVLAAAEDAHGDTLQALNEAKANLASANADLDAARRTLVEANTNLETVKADVPTEKAAKTIDWDTATQEEREYVTAAMIGERINAWRVAQGLPALKVSDTLNAESKAWSEHILDNSTPGTWDGIAHAPSNGKNDPTGPHHGFSGEIITGTAGGKTQIRVGKNLIEDYSDTAFDAVERWENSPAHNSIMSGANWDTMSIGYAERWTGSFWEAFATVRFYDDSWNLKGGNPNLGDTTPVTDAYYLSDTQATTGLDVTSDLATKEDIEASMQAQSERETTENGRFLAPNDGIKGITGYEGTESPTQADWDAYNERVNEAQDTVDTATADVATKESAVTDATDEVTAREADVADTKGAVDDAKANVTDQEAVVAEAEQGVAKAQADEDLAADKVEAAQQRIDDLADPEAAIDQAQAELEAAQAAVPEVEANGQEMVAQAEDNLADAEAAQESATDEVETAQAAIAPAEEAVAQAQAEYDSDTAIVDEVIDLEAAGETVTPEQVTAADEANTSIADLEETPDPADTSTVDVEETP